MAYSGNGQGYGGQYPRYQAPNAQQSQYGYQYQPQQQQLSSQSQDDAGRRSSFETGDDSRYFAGGGGPAPAPAASGGYGGQGASYETSGGGNTGFVRMPDQSHYAPASNGPNRQQSSSTYGYPSHTSHSPPNTYASHAPYNPQQYASTAAHATPMYAAAAPPPQVNTSMAHQPYNPAAYQSPTSPGQNQSYGFNLYEAAGRRQQTMNQTNPPTLPARTTAPDPPPRPQQTQLPTPGFSQPSQSSLYGGYSSSGQPSVNTASTYTPPRPPAPPSADSYNDQPTGRTYSYEHANSYSSPSSAEPGGHHRYPSLPTYPSGGEYTTSQARTKQGSQGSGQRGSTSSYDTSNRHPQSRPLPAAPMDSPQESSSAGSSQSFGYDAILQEVEDAVMGRPTSSSYRGGSTPKPDQSSRTHGGSDFNPLFDGPDTPHARGSNGMNSRVSNDYRTTSSSDSDAEAAAGLAALRMAEEQDEADRQWRDHVAARSNSHSSQHMPTLPRRPGSDHPPPVPPKIESSSDSDQATVDMEMYGGGMPGNVPYHYGNDYSGNTLSARPSMHSHTTSSTSAHSDRSADTYVNSGIDYYMPSAESIHPFPSLGARTDTGGTGGLSEPSAIPRRESFDDGDEATLYEPYDQYGGSSGAASPSRESSHSRNASYDYRNRSNSRPLPQLPPRRGAVDHAQAQDLGAYGGPDGYGDAYGVSAATVRKMNSVGSYGQPPVAVHTPVRHATLDSDQRRHGMQITTGSGRPGMYESTLSPESARMPRDSLGDIMLPSLPAGKRNKFVPARLTTHDYQRCPEPWALSSILDWLQEMTEGEADLREHLLADGLVALFTHKVPTMNVADAEALGAQLVQQMFAEGALMHEEEWAKFTGVRMSGVVYQLTGAGCYAPMLHNAPGYGRCYSHHCMRTLKKIDLATHDLAPQRKTEDWATFYKLRKDDVMDVDKKEIERQNNLHEIITSEDVYMDQLNVLMVLYRDGLRTSKQPIMPAKKVEEFIRDVFGKVDPVKKANEDYLLAQLKYRQEEQGPWIRGFSDIFREWIRKAKAAYIDYAGMFPAAALRMRKEAERNPLFRQFLDQIRENERSRRLGWDTYLKAPITRLQRYSLLLATVHKHSMTDNEEKRNLEKAIEEIKNVTLECDARVAEMGKRTDLMELSGKLKLRPGMERVQLNLNHLGREVIFRGDLQRRSSNKVSWVDSHAILFDHYFVLGKPVQRSDSAGSVRQEVYDVSKLPIPMDLLVLESTNDEPVVKSTVKGVTTAGARVANQQQQDMRLGRAASNTTGTTAVSSGHQTSGSMSISSGSSKNVANQTALDGPNDKIMYPFRIKHLGRTETYVLYAPTSGNRQDWCDKIIEAKTRHASSLFAQNAEPFRMRVLGDTAFNYESSVINTATVVIKGTPLDRAIEECDRSFYGTGPRANTICRAKVNCATSFSPSFGPRMMAVGTDFGVFLSEYTNPRGWVKCAAISINNVTQIAAIEEFSLFLVLADKSLIAYSLDAVCPPSGGPPLSEARKPPQKLSGSKDVGFFNVGKQKDRMLIFYKKKEGISSTFKVLEPVYQRGGSGRSRFGMKKGATDFCREYDEFYIPSVCYSINLFDKSLAISTERGVEVLTLDKKQPFSIPDLRSAEVASIAARIKEQKPLGMFRLNDNEFLLVFANVGIYVDKHGDVSRAVVMEFVGTAKEAALYNNTYLVLVDKDGDFLEVRNAINGRLRQVVSGRDVRLLDMNDGAAGGTIKMCMQHPEREKVQLVLEMIVNEGQKE